MTRAPVWRAAYWRSMAVAGAALATAAMAGCAEVGSGPNVPAAIELSVLPSPSVVIGDTLRDVNGVVAPIQAIVRNLQGDIITDANVRYLYADFARDSALKVDSVTGIVVALKAPTGGEARLAARVGTVLQILKTITVTVRPDSIDRVGLAELSVFFTTLPDTGRSGATANSSPELSVTVRNTSLTGVTTPVSGWPVQFALIVPANATNDTTRAVFLVDDQRRASVLDTTDGTGRAGRKVRIRANLFPVGASPDSVVVQATSTYRGVPLKGAPVRIVLRVRRDTVVR